MPPGPGQVPGADDGEQVRRAQAGDHAAFNTLVLRYQDAVYSLCFRLTGNGDDAADATQDAFIAALRHLPDFRGGTFRSWLLRIASNAAYDIHRRRRRRPTVSLDGDDERQPEEREDEAPGPEAQTLHHELGEVLQAGLLSLPEHQRLAVVLSDLHGYDYASIAEITGTELGTVKSRINRGRRRLRDYLLACRELLPARYRLSERHPRTSDLGTAEAI